MKPKRDWTGPEADLRAGMTPINVSKKWGMSAWVVRAHRREMGLSPFKPGRAAHAIVYTAEQDADLGNIDLGIVAVAKKWGLKTGTAYDRRRKLLQGAKAKKQAAASIAGRMAPKQYIVTETDLAEMLERKRAFLGLDRDFFYGPWMEHAGKQYLGR